MMAKATGIDTEKNMIYYRLKGNNSISKIYYDHLIVALGSVTNLPNVLGLNEYGHEIKSLSDAVALEVHHSQVILSRG